MHQFVELDVSGYDSRHTHWKRVENIYFSIIDLKKTSLDERRVTCLREEDLDVHIEICFGLQVLRWSTVTDMDEGLFQKRLAILAIDSLTIRRSR